MHPRERTLSRWSSPLHRRFGLKVLEIPEYRGDGDHPPITLVLEQAILRLDVAFDPDPVPLRGVAAIVHRHVVMLAPEIGHGVEFQAFPQHVDRCGLALPLGDHPVFHPDIFARMRIGPARDIARRVDAAGAARARDRRQLYGLEVAPAQRACGLEVPWSPRISGNGAH